jgi:uncharacterized protein YaaQ
MKMVMAVIPRDQAESVLQALVSAGHTATFVESRGGVLRQAWKILFIGVGAEELDAALSVIRDSCRSKIKVESEETRLPFGGSEETEAEVGGAAVWVWDIEKFETY